MSKRDKITLIGAALIGALVLLKARLPLDEPPEPPPAVYLDNVISMSLNDSIVKVDCYYGGDRWYGSGVIMDGCVITSEMIFSSGVESIVVTLLDGSIKRAEILLTNSIWGLTALKIDGIIGVEVDDAPNLPPDATTVVHTIKRSVDAQVVGYINQDWMLLTGIDESFVGAPLVNGGKVSGIIIGMNSANPSQAIAAGNRALNEFVKQTANLSRRPGGGG